jgi:TonB family protein
VRIVASFCLVVLAACGNDQSSRQDAAGNDIERGFELPVATNAESPVFYPVDLFEQEVEGSVVLRLFITAEGAVVPESTQVAETSGIPVLDSAAVAGVAEMTFAPARRNGTPVATLFLQPVHFRHPARTGLGDQR